MKWVSFIFITWTVMMNHFLSNYSTTGCIFDNELESVDTRYNRKIDYLNKLTSSQLSENLYNTSHEALWENMDNIAGPFNISDSFIQSGSSESLWDHTDQFNWGAQFPQCDGSFQSPINIDTSEVRSKKAPCIKWHHYDDIHPQMNIINNGHTVEVRGPWGSGDPSEQPTMDGGPLNGSYQLANVHAHWGDFDIAGAEHTINEKKYAMEMHFVHFKTTYGNASVALASGDPEAIAVVALLFKSSKLVLASVVSMLSTLTKAQKGQLIFPAVFPLKLMQAPLGTYYYTYVGSLTTPQCNENVRWIVFEQPLPVPYESVNMFKSYKNKGSPMVNNFRYTRPMNNKIIYRQKAC